MSRLSTGKTTTKSNGRNNHDGTQAPEKAQTWLLSALEELEPETREQLLSMVREPTVEDCLRCEIFLLCSMEEDTICPL
jgi:hypothetical protein